MLYVANIGDTRAVLSSNGIAERLSIDHKSTNETEVSRIKRDGGLIFGGRVGGQLAITRAFGDYFLKSDGVIANPYIKRHVLKASDRYLIIASDGVWDVIEDQVAVNFCKEDCSTKDIAKAIAKTAIEKGSRDNISCMVIRFNKQMPY